MSVSLFDREAETLAAVSGVVVIGRNEGSRLEACLDSVTKVTACLVYVDSGSSDDSVARARARGLSVVQLDRSAAFTASRARNAGFYYLQQLAPELRYVQFIDGDCMMAPAWLDKAVRFLDEHHDIAVVCGRLHERFPERSIYNALCDIEWDAPVGEIRACGGIAMMRSEAFEKIGGFRSELISGEEPDLCIRLRASGWRVWRLADEMAVHDAAITRFGQWWTRAKRAGYAFAAGAALHGAKPERHYVKEARRALFWGAVLPLLIVLAVIVDLRALAFLLVFPAEMVRIAMKGPLTGAMRWWRAGFLVLSRFPESLGCLKYALDTKLGRRAVLIEYK